MSFVEIILLCLKVLSGLTQWLHDRGKINEGYDKAIAEASLQIFNKTAYAKRIGEKIDDMSGADIDVLLRELAADPTKR
jgi:hypothetical protein